MSDIKNGPAEKEAPDSKKQIREKRKAISKWPVVLAVFCAAAAIFMLSLIHIYIEVSEALLPLIEADERLELV